MNVNNDWNFQFGCTEETKLQINWCAVIPIISIPELLDVFDENEIVVWMNGKVH